jgi:hypothetical protein
MPRRSASQPRDATSVPPLRRGRSGAPLGNDIPAFESHLAGSPLHAPNSALFPEANIAALVAAAASAGLPPPQGAPAGASSGFDLASLMAQVAVATVTSMQQQAALAVPPPHHRPSAPMPTLRYDINNPPAPPYGTECYKVRHVSNYEFSKATKEFSLDQFLARWESYCELTNAAFPVALISAYLTKEAGTWFTGAFAGKSLFTITWVEFCTAIHASSLVDIMADQRALDDAKALMQGGSSIKNYIVQATTIYNGRLAHKNLKHYPEFYFIEMFRSGLNPEIKARLPAITDSTYFTTYTSLALTIGVPLEGAAASTLPPPTRRPWTPSRGGGGGGGGRFGQRSNPAGLNNVLPTPPDSLNSLDEAARAAWERTNCTVDERRQLRMQRNACTYCGISSHTRDRCPELAKRATGTNAIAPPQDDADLNAVRFEISPPN